LLTSFSTPLCTSSLILREEFILWDQQLTPSRRLCPKSKIEIFQFAMAASMAPGLPEDWKNQVDAAILEFLCGGGDSEAFVSALKDRIHDSTCVPSFAAVVIKRLLSRTLDAGAQRQRQCSEALRSLAGPPTQLAAAQFTEGFTLVLEAAVDLQVRLRVAKTPPPDLIAATLAIAPHRAFRGTGACLRARWSVECTGACGALVALFLSLSLSLSPLTVAVAVVSR